MSKGEVGRSLITESVFEKFPGADAKNTISTSWVASGCKRMLVVVTENGVPAFVNERLVMVNGASPMFFKLIVFVTETPIGLFGKSKAAGVLERRPKVPKPIKAKA